MRIAGQEVVDRIAIRVMGSSRDCSAAYHDGGGGGGGGGGGAALEWPQQGAVQQFQAIPTHTPHRDGHPVYPIES